MLGSLQRGRRRRTTSVKAAWTSNDDSLLSLLQVEQICTRSGLGISLVLGPGWQSRVLVVYALHSLVQMTRQQVLARFGTHRRLNRRDASVHFGGNPGHHTLGVIAPQGQDSLATRIKGRDSIQALEQHTISVMRFVPKRFGSSESRDRMIVTKAETPGIRFVPRC